MKKHIILNILLLIISHYFIFAQNDTVNFENKNVFISTSYKPIIYDADKINISPKIVEIKKEKKVFSYLLFPQPVNYKFGELKNIPYVTMRNKKDEEFNKFYLKFGVGTLLNPDLLFAFGSKFDKSSLFSLSLNHNSKFADFKSTNEKEISSSYSNTGINFNFLKIRKTNNFYSSIKYNVESFDYYGFNDIIDSIIPNEEQTYHKLDCIFYLQSNTKPNNFDINYKTFLNYKLLYSKNENIENHFKLNGVLKKLFKVKPFNFLSNNFNYKFNFNFQLKYINYSISKKYINSEINNSSLKNTENLDNTKLTIYLAPSFDLIKNNNFLKLGFNFSIYSGVNESNANIFPEIKAKYSIYEDIFSIIFNIDGEVNENSIYNLTNENKYLNQIICPDASITKFRFLTSLNTNISKETNLSTYFSYQFTDNMLFFTNDSIANNKFNAIFDNIKLLKIGAIFNSKFNEFSLNLNLNYYKYFLNKLEYAWHKPSFSINLNLEYKLNNNLFVSSSLNLITERKTLIKNKTIKTIEAIPMLNLKFDYIYLNNLTFYANCNNILFTKNSFWNNYYQPSISLNIGMIYKF